MGIWLIENPRQSPTDWSDWVSWLVSNKFWLAVRASHHALYYSILVEILSDVIFQTMKFFPIKWLKITWSKSPDPHCLVSPTERLCSDFLFHVSPQGQFWFYYSHWKILFNNPSAMKWSYYNHLIGKIWAFLSQIMSTAFKFTLPQF